MVPLNILNFIFINFILAMVIFGMLMNVVEPYLPILIKQSLRYGKMSHKGEQCKIASMLEVPKSWFRHFYVFAIIYSTSLACIALLAFVFQLQQPSDFVLEWLDLLTGSSRRPVQVQSSVCLVAMILINLQCWRRWYETHFVQIFSSNSKINLSHYIVGYMHYFATITGILANAEGFVKGSSPRPFHLGDLSLVQYLAISLFLYSWYQQYQSNLIFVHLRTDKGGKVVTEKHLIPEGGWFEVISSPHMFFEMTMYISLMMLMPNCVTTRFAAIWVVVNQIYTALLTHKWYKETFGPKYPQKRKAILPLLL